MPFIGVAQPSSLKPKWLKETPKARNSTYEFKSFRVQASSPREAKLMLPDEAAYYLERSFDVEGVSVELPDVSQRYRNGDADVSTTTQLHDVVQTTAGKVNVTLRVIDEYRDGKDNYFLCAIPNPEARRITYDPVMVTEKYGAKGLMSIIPSLGQFYKHHYLKGGLILGGSVALAGGVIFTHMTYRDYEQKISLTHNVHEMKVYKNRSNHFKLARNICIGALGALYIYNLIDACVTPGARYVKFIKSDKRGNTYALMPSVSFDGTPMAVAAITF